MKKILTILLLAFSALILNAQQIRRVYITLDVSGSMGGDKYILANYTAQMIATLCDDEDDVSLIIGGNPISLSRGQDQLKDIQYPFSQFSSIPTDVTQFGDIIGFNSIYAPSSKKQDWLFIIGDGDWGTGRNSFTTARNQFQSIIESGNLNVCFLQTGYKTDEHSDFLQFIEPMGIVDIKKSSVNPKSIREGCDHFAKKILGFSNVPLKVKSSGKNTVTLRSELPLSEFVVLYQDEVEEGKLPNLQNASFDGKALTSTLRGTPTTSGVRGFGGAVLSGKVWRVTSGNYIPEKQEIVLEFDKGVSTKNISVFPVVKEVEFSGMALTVDGKNLKADGVNVVAICKEEKKASVKVGINDSARQLVSDELLKKTSVEVKANNRSYTARYQNGFFYADIDLKDAETQYYAEIDCPGYFKRVTGISTIRKVECKEAELPEKRNLALDAGSLTFDDLKREEIKGVIEDKETLQILDPNKFDLSAKIDEGYYYEEPEVSLVGNEIHIKARPKSDLCECLFPRKMVIRVTATQKQGAFDDEQKQYSKIEQPIIVDVVKNRPWLSRCMWVLITIGILLLLLIYIRALLKKKRFKKNAMISAVYFDYYGSPVRGTGNRYLRKDGFGAWLARWFSPRDERIVLSWNKPSVSAFLLLASDSKEVVNIPKKGFSPAIMSIPGYDPEFEAETKDEFIKWGSEETISVSKRDGGKDGELTFSSGEDDDGTGYKLFLGILFALFAAVEIILVALLLLRSF